MSTIVTRPEKPCKKCGGTDFFLYIEKGKYKKLKCRKCHSKRTARHIVTISDSYIAGLLHVPVASLSQNVINDVREMITIRRKYKDSVHSEVRKVHPEYDTMSLKDRNALYTQFSRKLLKQDSIMENTTTSVTTELTAKERRKIYSERWKARKEGKPLPALPGEVEKNFEETIDFGKTEAEITSAFDDVITSSKQLTQSVEKLMSKRDEILIQIEKLKALLNQF